MPPSQLAVVNLRIETENWIAIIPGSMTTDPEVIIIGGGVAGLTAGIFTARHDFQTRIITGGSSLLRRNAHLENYPGFPAGINSRLLLDMMQDHADASGCEFQATNVTRLANDDDGYSVTTADGETHSGRYVIAATKNTTDYLPESVQIIREGSKEFVETDPRGRTMLPGLYAAGRLAQEPHQAIVCAGHGAKVAVTLLEDADVGFYHDWVAPERYFTGRARDVPPGCEEIDESERRARERGSLATMREYLASPHRDVPEQHPSVESGAND